MKLSLLCLVPLALVVVGCSAPEAADAPKEQAKQETVPTPDPSGSVQIHGGGAGAIAPVTGTENLQGAGGGGVGQAAKEKAKSMGGTAPSSLDQLPKDGE